MSERCIAEWRATFEDDWRRCQRGAGHAGEHAFGGRSFRLEFDAGVEEPRVVDLNEEPTDWERLYRQADMELDHARCLYRDVLADLGRMARRLLDLEGR